ncbi:cobyric acid synthase [Agromyces atrinae]|uniref:type 1 glutamine amidotransferase n=1 Tax=Agromyces atrinae TaxID=592376 RepID=UPI001F5845C8|nr:cobyric acid synthase [Agromyces atrinae]MCI2958690.1 cobyric acid synthase [Agromyces atrinae]
MTLEIVSLLPSLLNTNGDAENARVLLRRAEWAGIDARVRTVERAAELPSEPDLVVIGSGSDASLGEARLRLLDMLDELRRWGTDRVGVLAVGTGWELLSWGIEFASGEQLEGLGVLPGRAVPRVEGRVTGDLVITRKGARLVGFENHERDYVGAEASPLGRVVSGAGNGRGSSQEGVVTGTVIGTHLHGPVLAKNPTLADQMLTTAAERRGIEYQVGSAAVKVDDFAKGARNAVLRSLSLPED